MTQPFLNISHSLSGRKWVGPAPDAYRLAEKISEDHQLPLLLAQILVRQNVELDAVESYLAPKLKELIPDPSVLRDMDKATARFVKAVLNQERIAIFGDYDVDGAASSALLIDWLRGFNIRPTLYIPDRIDEGYGPNEAAMRELGAAHDLIICVDCGTLSHAPIEAAGTDVIVLDHHIGGETLPKAHAIVNPNRQDESGNYGYLCAAAVVYLLLISANRSLRAEQKQTPDLIALLDLVALATIADVAPLIGVNRAFVRQGLTVMARRERVGLVALSDCAGINTAPTSYHLGYVLGPRINAGGRIGKSDLGARLLSTQNEQEAASLAEDLNTLNRERQGIEADVLALALEQAASQDPSSPLIWAAGDGWHPGVVGIVAARLKEAHNRPSIVIGFDGGDGKGSGRSVGGIDLGSAIARCAHEGLIEKGGGHKMAAGLSLKRDQLAPAMHRLSELLARQGADKIGAAELTLDGMIALKAATLDLVESLQNAGPFGASAPAPKLALASARIKFSKRVGTDHLKLTLCDETGATIEAILFKAFSTPIGAALEAHNGQSFHFAGRLEIDEWRGQRKVKFNIIDVAENKNEKNFQIM